MKEKWIKWDPFSGLSGSYYIESIKESSEGLEIILADSGINAENKKNKIVMKFSCRVTSYRSTDEASRVSLFESLSKQHGTDFYAKWKFFKVENSEYLDWLSKESCEYTDFLNLKHYVIIDDDSLLDIASMCDPDFEIIK